MLTTILRTKHYKASSLHEYIVGLIVLLIAIIIYLYQMYYVYYLYYVCYSISKLCINASQLKLVRSLSIDSSAIAFLDDS